MAQENGEPRHEPFVFTEGPARPASRVWFDCAMVAVSFVAATVIMQAPDTVLTQLLTLKIILDGGTETSLGLTATLLQLAMIVATTVLVALFFVATRVLWDDRRGGALVSIRGRLSRRDYGLRWILPLVLFGVLLAVVLGLCSLSGITVFGPAAIRVSIPFAVLGLLLVWPTLTVHARRLHDCDLSAWWLLLLALPVANLVFQVVMLVLRGTPGRNRFGDPAPR